MANPPVRDRIDPDEWTNKPRIQGGIHLPRRKSDTDFEHMLGRIGMDHSDSDQVTINHSEFQSAQKEVRLTPWVQFYSLESLLSALLGFFFLGIGVAQSFQPVFLVISLGHFALSWTMERERRKARKNE